MGFHPNDNTFALIRMKFEKPKGCLSTQIARFSVSSSLSWDVSVLAYNFSKHNCHWFVWSPGSRWRIRHGIPQDETLWYSVHELWPFRCICTPQTFSGYEASYPSQRVSKLLNCISSSKVIVLKLLSHLPRNNELKYRLLFPLKIQPSVI